jgi:hypothetical protein
MACCDRRFDRIFDRTIEQGRGASAQLRVNARNAGVASRLL